MIQNDIEVLVVKQIKFHFNYQLVKGKRRIYYKDYQTNTPYEINIDKLKEVPYNSSVTILIKYKKNYYWCPQFEECYKDYQGSKDVVEVARNGFIRRTTMDLTKAIPLLKFSTRVKFESNDLKQIIIKDANN